jgi:hypothetical protein
LEDLPCGVCGTVVHHDNFVQNSVQSNLEVEVMQTSSSRAGMTTESSVSGRAGLVSGGFGISIPSLTKQGGLRHGPGWRR